MSLSDQFEKISPINLASRFNERIDYLSNKGIRNKCIQQGSSIEFLLPGSRSIKMKFFEKKDNMYLSYVVNDHQEGEVGLIHPIKLFSRELYEGILSPLLQQFPRN